MQPTSHHSYLMFRNSTNASPGAELESPSSRSRNITPAILNIPPEILIMIAAYLPERDLFSLLLAAKAFPLWLLHMVLKLRLTQDKSRTFLHYVVLNGSSIQMRHILKDKSCRTLLNIPDQDGATPLHLAASLDPCKCKELLDADADIVPLKDGSTSLHLAPCSDLRMRPELAHMCEELLHAGADVNARNELLETPIFCAVDAGCAETVKVLRAHHADLRVVEENNFTVEQKAIMYGREDLILAVKAKAASREHDGYQELAAATAHEFIETLKKMIGEGKNPFEEGRKGALSVIACWRSGGRIYEGLENLENTQEVIQQVSATPKSSTRKRHRTLFQSDESPFEKKLKLMAF